MARIPKWRTEPVCDRVAIRKNPVGRYQYSIGRYYTKTSTIGLRICPGSIKSLEQEQGADIETVAAKALLHEVTHWAQYLFLDRYAWGHIGAGWQGIAYSDRIVERIAMEIEQTWDWNQEE